MNCVMGDCGRNFGAGCLRRIQTNLPRKTYLNLSKAIFKASEFTSYAIG